MVAWVDPTCQKLSQPWRAMKTNAINFWVAINPFPDSLLRGIRSESSSQAFLTYQVFVFRTAHLVSPISKWLNTSNPKDTRGLSSERSWELGWVCLLLQLPSFSVGLLTLWITIFFDFSPKFNMEKPPNVDLAFTKSLPKIEVWFSCYSMLLAGQTMPLFPSCCN